MADIPIDYTSAEYADIRADLLRRADALMPEWTSRSEADFGVVLAELWSHAADLNNYGIDRMLRESFLPTALTRESVLTLAGMLGYTPHGAVAANGSVTLISETSATQPITVPAGTAFISVYVDDIDGPVRFESTADAVVPSAGGTVAVTLTEGTTVTKLQIGISTGTAAQRLTIPHQNVIDGAVRIFIEGQNADLEWNYVPRLVYSGPADLVFTTRPDGSGTTSVLLGDGVNGQIPELGARIFATYRYGTGGLGNLAAGNIEFLSSDIPGVSVATDGAGKPIATAMTGGSAPESVDEIRRHASAAYAAHERAVTVADYARIALTVPGVSAANAISQIASSVLVYIAGPDRSVPSPALITSTQTQLGVAGMAGVTVTVGAPTMVQVNFGTVGLPVHVYAAPTWRNAVVDQQVRTTLTQLMRSSDLGFGGRVTVGRIYTVLGQLPGVINITIPMMARSDAPQTGIDDIVLAPWELPILGAVAITTTGGVT